jgi:hypothetical protein
MLAGLMPWLKGFLLRIMSHIATSTQQWDISTNMLLFSLWHVYKYEMYFSVQVSLAKHSVRVGRII